MNTRMLFIVCLVLSIVAILMFASTPSNSTVVSAQGPDLPSDQATQSSSSKSPENLGDGGPDARLPGVPTACGSSPLNCLYYHISSSIFQGRTSTYSYIYTGSGCFYHTNASTDGFMAPVLISPGSVIKYIRIYYKDTNASDMPLSLRYFDDGISNSDLVSVSTSGNAAGVRTALSAEITHTIDYANYSYGIIAFEGSSFTDSSIQICGVRLAYVQGTFGLAFPYIAR